MKKTSESLRRFNEVVALMNFAVVGLILAMCLFMLLQGCTTSAPEPNPITDKCRAPRIFMYPEHGEWTPQDATSLLRALDACKEKFRNSPCLVRFVRTEPGNYHATCGEENN